MEGDKIENITSEETEAQSLSELKEENERLRAQLEQKTGDMDHYLEQMQKLSNVTRLIAEGHYFFYHPRKVNEDDDNIEILAQNFNTMVRAIKEYREGLEQMVQERTQELEKSLVEVQELKLQQDADYYLTSLLINPLSSNKAKSENIHIEFYIRQKKQFKFKKWETSIGGDMCSAHNIRLMGKDYTVFLNADAMGKSIQGAGGALVLGAVFESIVKRTLLRKEEQNQPPARWLKNTFIELHKVFESFDGTMMVSLVMGMVDHDQGRFYWLNAEHPLFILYQDGKAAFLKDEVIYRKVGMLVGRHVNWKDLRKDEPLKVQVMKLKPGDVLFAGSDGRDDISLGIDEDGNRIINEDDTMILRLVDQAKGLLEPLTEGIMASGDLTDDLSLLRLEFTGLPAKPGEALDEIDELLARARKYYDERLVTRAIQLLHNIVSQFDNNRRALRDLTIIYFKEKIYQRALEFGRQYLELEPDDEQVMVVVFRALIKVGNHQGAADVGEELVSHFSNPRYLDQLARVYLKLENVKRARVLCKKIEELEPEAEELEELKRLLDKHS